MTARLHQAVASFVFVSGALIFSHPVLAQFSQQGSKLVASDATEFAAQGVSVALSAAGNTALVGGPGDNNDIGAAWVWTRTGGVWTQQSLKLVGSNPSVESGQGSAVALSADGSTALIGAAADGDLVGAAWVWTRSSGVWTQQSPKLIASDNTGNAGQGYSVALSADGNTALVGGYNEGNAGAAWVWIRNNSNVWLQQGLKLVGSGGVPGPFGKMYQGRSVSLSADGNTALVGGPFDNNGAGAAWVWTRSNGVWTQQGAKLVGTGAVGAAQQGSAVALSADGNTAVIGGPYDNSRAGAIWVWTRNAGVWTQQGPKLVGSGGIGSIIYKGASLSLSADGNTALVGGYNDNIGAGAVWVWARTGGIWTQQGTKLVGTGAVGNALQGYSVSISASGDTALVGGYSDNAGKGAVWVFAGATGGFTDDPLIAGATSIRAVHVTELRSRIDALRARDGLAPYTYTTSTIIAGTSILKAVDILELRAALAAVYTAEGLAPPSYTTSPGAGLAIVVADIAELRAAVVAIE